MALLDILENQVIDNADNQVVSLLENPDELDYMEYANDAAAQAAYVSNGAAISDQIYSPGFTAGYYSSVLYSNTYYFWSNEFVPSVTAPCPQIKVGLIRIGAPTGNCWIEIQTDDGAGRPSNTAVTNGTSVTKDVTTISNVELTWYTFTFATPPTLTASTKYHIVAKGDYAVSTTANIGWATGTATGIGAERKYCNNSLVWSDQSYRQCYETFYTALQSYSEATIKQQGSYSLKGVALITNSLNKTLTRTVSPTINLTGDTQIKYGIYAGRTGMNIKLGIRDSGLTITEHTANISSAGAWETQTWDISAVANADKDAIDRIIITILNADADNTFYLDNVYGTVVQNYTKDFSETLTLSEVILKGSARSFTETTTLSETFIKGTGKIFLDIITPSEVYARVWALIRVFSDTITPTEIYSRSAGLIRSFTETITLTEVSMVKALTRLFSETVTLSEVFRRGITRLWSETITLTEVAVKDIAIFFTETLSLTDTIAKAATLARTFTDTITLTDTFTKALKWLHTSHIASVWAKATKALSTWAKATKSTTTWTKKYG